MAACNRGLRGGGDWRNAAAMMSPLLVALAVAAAPPETEVVAIPPASIDNSLEIIGDPLAAEQQRSRLFIAVGINDSGPYRFLVDSGADRSVVAQSLADRLRLPDGPIVKLQGMAGTAHVRTVVLDRLTIGSSAIAGITAPVLMARDLGAEGLIGIDALADQRLLLDFDKKTITVQDSRINLPAMDGEIIVTARRRKGQLILTQASVASTKISAVIDTGSEITLGNLALMRRYLGRRSVTTLKTTQLISVTGQSLTAYVATLSDVRLGGITLNNVTIAFADAPPFALFGIDKEPSLFLGSDLLKSFRRVALDFRHRKVRFVLRR
ncbi:MAG: hypothetical protein RL490_804 [Pseudomonadota bacterium]